jgi:hypothetical protein
VPPGANAIYRWETEQRYISVVWLRSVRFGCLSGFSVGSFSRVSLSALSLGFSRLLLRFSAIFSWTLLMKMLQMALFGSALSGPFQRASRCCYQPGSSSPLAVLRLME